MSAVLNKIRQLQDEMADSLDPDVIRGALMRMCEGSVSRQRRAAVAAVVEAETREEFLEAVWLTHMPMRSWQDIGASSDLITEIESLRQVAFMENVGLVHRYVNRWRHSQIPIEDLEQEGYVGLLNAVRRYDVSRGLSAFSTYANYHIDQVLIKYLHKNVRGVSQLEFRQARRDEEGVDEGETPLELASQTEVMQAARDSLTEAEFNVLKLRFGLEGEREHSSAEIATLLGIKRTTAEMRVAFALRYVREFLV